MSRALRPIPVVDRLAPDVTAPPTTPTRAEIADATQVGVVARRVSQLAAERDLSAAALAKQVGAETAQVVAVLEGEAPSSELLRLLASGLGTTPAGLVRPEAYLSTEVAAMVGVTARTVTQWVQARRLAGDRAENGRYWIPAAEVARLKEMGGHPERRPGGKVPFPPIDDLGLRIFALMHRAGLTQVELSRASGIKQPRLSVLMCGRPTFRREQPRQAHNPSIVKLRSIAAGLGVSAADLVRGLDSEGDDGTQRQVLLAAGIDDYARELRAIAQGLGVTPAELLEPPTDEARALVDTILNAAA